jgi:hypothetical protein
VLPRAAPIRIRSGNKIKKSAEKRLTLAGKIDRIDGQQEANKKE